MELTGKLKEDVAKCETREEAKGKIEEAGVILNDDELDAVAGGGGISFTEWQKRKDRKKDGLDGLYPTGS